MRARARLKKEEKYERKRRALRQSSLKLLSAIYHGMH